VQPSNAALAGMVSFEVRWRTGRAGHCAQDEAVHLAESLGRIESLIDTPADDARQHRGPAGGADNLIRLSVGIESATT